MGHLERHRTLVRMDRQHHENPKTRTRSSGRRPSSLRSPTKTPGRHLARDGTRGEPRIHLGVNQPRSSRDWNSHNRTARGWIAREHDTHLRWPIGLLFGWLMRSVTQRYLQLEANGLKALCEQMTHSQNNVASTPGLASSVAVANPVP